jgi:hypothetical protein
MEKKSSKGTATKKLTNVQVYENIRDTNGNRKSLLERA